MFADDIALISDSEDKMQQMLDCLHSWCSRWRLALNMGKTKVVHFRQPSQERTNTEFKYGAETVLVTDKYKYLGLWMNEFMYPIKTVQPLSTAAGRAFGAITTKC